MLKITNKHILNLKILRFFIIPPIFVFTPFLNNIQDAKGALEFQWDQDDSYRRLKWFQKENKRKFNGLDSVAILDCQQMHVSNDVDFCIRIMAQVLLPHNYAIKHPYLRGAAKLRTDRC